jgi:hypothetical protein
MTFFSRVFSSLLLSTILLSGCSTERKEIPITRLKDVMTNLAPTPKTFEINPAEETLLTGAKGTKIFIPADAFQFADGTSPTSTVKIVIKECYTISDMIAENLSTTSGDRILETAGMIRVNATADGKELSVKEGKAVVVGFPKGNQMAEMDLFYEVNLGDTMSTWIPDYQMYEVEAMQTATSNRDSVHGIESDILISPKYPIEMTDDLYDYGFMMAATTGTLDQLPLVGRRGTILDYIDDPTTIADSIARKFYDNDWRVYYQFNIDERGKMKNFRSAESFWSATNNPYARKTVKRYFENAPAFDLTGDSIKVKHNWDYVLGVSASKRLNKGRFKKKFREKYFQITNQAIQKLDKDATEYYLFSATEMGWINCDRFWDIDDEKKTDFIVTVPNPTDTKVHIIFKDIKSLMSPSFGSDKNTFENVPLEKQIRVIAISYVNGKPTLAIGETMIDNDGFELTGFKEFSLDELERALNK